MICEYANEAASAVITPETSRSLNSLPSTIQPMPSVRTVLTMPAMLNVSVDVRPMIWNEERLITAATTPETRKQIIEVPETVPVGCVSCGVHGELKERVLLREGSVSIIGTSSSNMPIDSGAWFMSNCGGETCWSVSDLPIQIW